MLTPCGLAVPESAWLRLGDEMDDAVFTGQEGRGRTGMVIMQHRTTVPPEIEARVALTSDEWLAWHDERCDCRSEQPC